MKQATREAVRWVAVVLVKVLPLDVLRGLERAIDREILRRAMHPKKAGK